MAKQTLSWQDDNEGVTGFQILRSDVVSYAGDMAQVGTVAGTERTYEEVVGENKPRYYRVTAQGVDQSKTSNEIALAYPAKVMPLYQADAVRKDWQASFLAGPDLGGGNPQQNTFGDGPMMSEMVMQTADGSILFFSSSGVSTFNPNTNTYALIPGSSNPEGGSWTFVESCQNSRGEILVLEGGGSRTLRRFNKTTGEFTDVVSIGSLSFQKMVMLDNDDIIFVGGNALGEYVPGTIFVGKWSDSAQALTTFNVPTDASVASAPYGGWVGLFDGAVIYWPGSSQWAVTIDPDNISHQKSDMGIPFPSAVGKRSGLPWLSGVIFLGGGKLYTLTIPAGAPITMTTQDLSTFTQPVDFTDNVSCGRVLPTGDYLFLGSGAGKAVQLSATLDQATVITGPAGGYSHILLIGNTPVALHSSYRWNFNWPAPCMLQIPDCYRATESNRTITRAGT